MGFANGDRGSTGPRMGRVSFPAGRVDGSQGLNVWLTTFNKAKSKQIRRRHNRWVDRLKMYRSMSHVVSAVTLTNYL